MNKTRFENQFVASFTNVVTLEESVRCYERRPRCLQYRGWCKAGLEFGFCSELNDLPDTPSEEHPLFEVTTFVYPKNVSKGLGIFDHFNRMRATKTLKCEHNKRLIMKTVITSNNVYKTCRFGRFAWI